MAPAAGAGEPVVPGAGAGVKGPIAHVAGVLAPGTGAGVTGPVANGAEDP